MNVATLRDLLTRQPPGTCVRLDVGSARFYRIDFSGPEPQTVAGPLAAWDGRCNAVDFCAGDGSVFTAAALLRLLDTVAGDNPHVAVFVDGGVASTVPVLEVNGTGRRELASSMLNPYRFAKTLDPQMSAASVYRALCLRYGHETADALVLYRLGDRWYGAAKLHRDLPLLTAHEDWTRLFVPCGAGSLRRCLVEDDGDVRAMLDGTHPPPEALLWRCGRGAPLADPTKNRPTATAASIDDTAAEAPPGRSHDAALAAAATASATVAAREV